MKHLVITFVQERVGDPDRVDEIINNPTFPLFSITFGQMESLIQLKEVADVWGYNVQEVNQVEPPNAVIKCARAIQALISKKPFLDVTIGTNERQILANIYDNTDNTEYELLWTYDEKRKQFDRTVNTGKIDDLGIWK